MQLPKKEYLSFDELAEKWKCAKMDLFHCIFNNQLTPSIYVNNLYKLVETEIKMVRGGLRNELFPVPIQNSDYLGKAKGFYYLNFIAVQNPYAIGTPFFSSVRRPEKSDQYYRLDGAAVLKFDPIDETLNVTIENESGDIFFTDEEVEKFEREYMQISKATEEKTQTATYPWGDHSTKLLTQLSEAAIKFWNLYDPTDPSTAPTNEQVKNSLILEGVPKRTAEVMATILRADGLKTGRRK